MGYVQQQQQNTFMHDIIYQNVNKQTHYKLCFDGRHICAISVLSYENYSTSY